MKTIASLPRALFILLIPAGICQCTDNYTLVDYKEYHMGNLEDHISYNYNEAGQLKSKTRFRWGKENTLTLYDVKRYETGIDTIETSYEIFVRDSTDYDQCAYKGVTSYTLDGIKRSSIIYGVNDGQWVKSTQMIFDEQGRMIERNWGDKETGYYYYDSLGRYIGCESRIYILDNKNDYGFEKDTLTYLSDGQFVIKTQYRYGTGSWVPISKTQFELDREGRIISRQDLDPDETDSIYYYLSKTMYRYDRKGRLKRETYYKCCHDTGNLVKDEETINIYLFGLKIRSIKYNYEPSRNVVSYVVYKYSFRHRLLLEEKTYDNILDRRLRHHKIWTYEK